MDNFQLIPLGGSNVEGSGDNYVKQNDGGAVNSSYFYHGHSAVFSGYEMDTHTHSVWLDGEGNPLPIMQPTLFIGNLFIHI